MSDTEPLTSSNKAAPSPPKTVRRRRRYLEWTCLVVLGFFVRSVYDVTVRDRGVFQQILAACSPMEIKGTEYRKHLPSTVGSTGISMASTLKPLSEKGLEFVFTIGLEGTGHHLMEATIKSSPAAVKMKSWNLETPVKKSISTLYHDKRLDGLFNMACLDDTLYYKKMNKYVVSSGYKAKDMSNVFNTMRQHNNLVGLLQNMQQRYDEMSVNDPQPLRLPLNSYVVAQSGEISYPNYSGKCRRLHYPVLDLVYNACEDAGVQCSHVYVYRHPLDILKSTTIKRTFNPPGMVQAAHLYTSHLKIIESQLRTYTDRTRGCLGFFDRDNTEEWQNTLRELWGWGSQNSTKFDAFVKKSYKAPSRYLESTSDNIIPEELEGIFPVEHLPYLEVMLKSHEETLRVCRQSLAGT